MWDQVWDCLLILRYLLRHFSNLPENNGGWGGIRTHETLTRLAVFKTAAFNRSATHPHWRAKQAHGAGHVKEAMGGGLASPMARRAIMRAMMPYGLPNKPLSRRRFLTGAAGAGLALAVLPRPAAAAVFDVRDFGAVPDNETDNARAFADALDAVLQAGGGEVLVPKGLYRLEAPWIVPDGAVDITLRGERGAYLMAGPGLDAGLLQIGRRDHASGQVENIGVETLRLHGRGATDPGTTNANGIELGNCLNVVVRDVHIQSFAGRGFVGNKPNTKDPGTTRRWEHVTLDRLSVRYTGLESILIGYEPGAGGATVDTIDMRGFLANNGGKRVTDSGAGEGGVYLQAVQAGVYGGQVSGIANDDRESGYRSAMVVRKAMGVVSGLHFEQNGNDQPRSCDLFLEDAHGMAVTGILHSCADPRSARCGIRVWSAGNALTGIRMEGGHDHVFDYVLDLRRAKDAEYRAITAEPAPARALILPS